jgi:hypothetical protein
MRVIPQPSGLCGAFVPINSVVNKLKGEKRDSQRKKDTRPVERIFLAEMKGESGKEIPVLEDKKENDCLCHAD